MTDEQLSRSDMRDIRRAINERWPIGEQFRSSIVRALLRIIADPTSSKREVIAASRTLIAAEKQNQEDDRDDAEADREGNRFLEVARQLGLEVAIERIPESGADDDSDAAARSEQHADASRDRAS
jgi:hypothetical protein